MKVKDLLKMDIDVDVYDDVCESLAIAFCGPQPLTEEGKKEFSEVLALPVILDRSFAACTVEIDDPDEKTWKRRLRKAKKLFESAAGYCAAEDWDKWFQPE